MKKTLLLWLFAILSTHCFGQWTTKIGINTIPLIARTLDVNSEFSYHPGFSFIAGAGGTFKTHHEGFINFQVDDGIKDRTTSGAFLKLGGRLNLNNLSGKVHRNNFFIGATAVVSYLRQTALRREFNQETREYTDNYFPVSAKGFAFAPVVSIGFWHQLSDKFSLEWGLQAPIKPNVPRVLGFDLRSYIPGMGSGQSNPFIPCLQGILTIKYKIGGPKN